MIRTAKLQLLLLTVLLGFNANSLFGQNQELRNLFFNSFTDVIRLDFTTTPPTPFPTGVAGSYEGIAHFEDGSTGNLLFWFNSNGVYDQFGAFMPGSTGIFANSSAAEICISPKPGNPDQYYIFYNQETCSSMYYSVVDMSLNAGAGDVIELNTLIDSGNHSEGMEVVQIPGTNDYWLLTYECGTGMTSFLVDDTGIGAGTTILSYPMPGGTYDGRGEMDYHKGKVAAGFAWSPQVLIYDFDPETGIASNEIELTSTTFNNSPFGVEFSPSGNKMYFSLWYTTGMNNVFQYNFETGDYTGYAPDLGGSVTGLGEIELGPDGNLYVIIDGGNNILVIEDPDCDDFTFDLIPITANTGLGISDHIQSFVYLEEATDTICVPANTPFTLAPDDDTVDYIWWYPDTPEDTLDIAVTYDVEMENEPLVINATGNVELGCGGVATTIFSYTLLPIPDIDAGPDLFISPGQSIQIQSSATVDANYTWVGSDLDDPFTLQPTASPAETTTYFVSASSSNGTCQAVDQMTIFVAENEETLCDVEGSTVDLSIATTLENPYWYDFSDPSTILSNSHTYTATYGSSLITLVGGGDIPGGSGSEQFIFNLQPAPPLDAGLDLTIFQGESIELAATGADAYGYTWLAEPSLSATDISNPIATPNQTTTYFVSSSIEDLCTVEDFVTVTVLVESLAIIDVCGIPGESSTIEVSDTILNVQWYEEATPDVILGSGSTYTFTATDQVQYLVAEGNDTDGNILRVSFVVTPTPVISAGSDIIIVAGDIAQLAATGGSSYTWEPAEFLDDPTSATPNATVTETTTFTVTNTDELGCTNTASVQVIVTTEGTVLVPSGFSPNYDGNNDVLELVTNNIATLEEFSIYNRWGERVFRSNDLNAGWDGTFKGKQSDVGVYVYVVKATEIDGDAYFTSGNVSLLR